jgi:hypothetical protein
VKKSSAAFGDFIDGALERSFVCLRRFAETADFPHELERGIPNFFGSDGRIEIEKNFDVPAHLQSPQDMRIPDR